MKCFDRRRTQRIRYSCVWQVGYEQPRARQTKSIQTQTNKQTHTYMHSYINTQAHTRLRTYNHTHIHTPHTEHTGAGQTGTSATTNNTLTWCTMPRCSPSARQQSCLYKVALGITATLLCTPFSDFSLVPAHYNFQTPLELMAYENLHSTTSSQPTCPRLDVPPCSANVQNSNRERPGPRSN